MTALLILGGTVLAVCGWLWLWWRSVRIHWFWALAGALPPLALLSGLLNLRRSLLPLLVHIAGLVLLAGGLWQLWQTGPQQFTRLMQGQWSEQDQANGTADRLQGQLQGQLFVPEQALLKQGILILRAGQEFIASKEIRLDLHHYSEALQNEVFTLDILPTDDGELPVIELLWQDPQSGQPQTRRVVRGYTLSLYLQRQTGGLTGQLYLSLPAGLATLVRGSFHIAVADELPLPKEKTAEDKPLEAESVVPETENALLPVFTLERLLSHPQNYLHQSLYVETVAGRQVRGEFAGMSDEGELLVKQVIKAPGFVIFRVQPGEISQITLDE